MHTGADKPHCQIWPKSDTPKQVKNQITISADVSIARPSKSKAVPCKCVRSCNPADLDAAATTWRAQTHPRKIHCIFLWQRVVTRMEQVNGDRSLSFKAVLFCCFRLSLLKLKDCTV